MDPISHKVLRPLSSLHAWARRHPGRLTSLALVALGGFAATAFGIAPLAPDAAALPQRLVAEPLPVVGLERQVEDLAATDLQLWRSEVTRPGDTADALLRRLGVVDASAAAFIRTDRAARRLVDGHGGKMVQARVSSDGSLLELTARFASLDEAQVSSHFTRLSLSRLNGQLLSRLELIPFEVQVRLGSGSVKTSLFAATDEAGLPDHIAAQLVDIFSTEIDFHRELHRGDSFSVVYESLSADGQPASWIEGAGRVLAAEFVHLSRRSQAIWFTDPATGKTGYFGPDGRSKRRGFLASPLEFSRQSSGFAMRLHPILQTWRAHNGIDYSAPTGTPVRTVGDGVVEKAGWQSGYGNVVTIQHGKDKSTVYAHLSRVHVRTGQRVVQGQAIGQVGATGWATGPHLHFEFRVAGMFQNPSTIARQIDDVPVDPSSQPRFTSLAMAAKARLDTAGTMLGYRVNAE